MQKRKRTYEKIAPFTLSVTGFDLEDIINKLEGTEQRPVSSIEYACINFALKKICEYAGIEIISFQKNPTIPDSHKRAMLAKVLMTRFMQKMTALDRPVIGAFLGGNHNKCRFYSELSMDRWVQPNDQAFFEQMIQEIRDQDWFRVAESHMEGRNHYERITLKRIGGTKQNVA